MNAIVRKAMKKIYLSPKVLRLRRRPALAVGTLVLMLIAAGATIASLQGCRRLLALFHHPNQCSLDERPIHPEMKVRVLLQGRKTATDGCCVRCAINYARQTGTTVHLLSVTDYATRRPIAPDRGLYVTGSDLSPCAMSHMPMSVSNGRREIETNEWDRCAPSSIAFATPDDAREFQKTHGGMIQSWKELVGSASVLPR